jgi:hypothetical protein
MMFSACRTSVSSIAATAGRRVLHSTMKSTKSTVESAAAPKSTAKVVLEASQAKSTGGIMNIAKEHPFAFQLAIATGKTSAADLMCQMVAERKSLNEVDWKRNAVFVVFGFAYLGCFQYYIQGETLKVGVIIVGVFNFLFGGIKGLFECCRQILSVSRRLESQSRGAEWHLLF